MPKNKQALLRYQVIDACLSNRFHESHTGLKAGYWPAETLADKMREELGVDVSPRTIRKDISELKNAVLGIEVPIANKRGMGYYYTRQGFHLFNMRLSSDEAYHLSEAVHHMDHLMIHQYFRQLSQSLKKLNVASIPYENMIMSLEAYNNPPAYKWLKQMVEAIEYKQVLELQYQPYFPPDLLNVIMHPYLIKEYNQRLYVLAYDARRSEYFVFGLDRIKSLQKTDYPWHAMPDGLKSKYFEHIMGVSLPRNPQIEIVHVMVHAKRIPYLLSKPMHPTQRYVEKKGEWGLMEYRLVINRELRRFILELGKDARVISPGHLCSQIVVELESALSNYK